MNRVELAFRTFFWIIFRRRFADAVQVFFIEEPAAQPEKAEIKIAAEKKMEEPPPPPRRNDAIQIMALLQREGRLIDFLQEPIDNYADAQIGAAVRDIHRDCGAALNRVLALKPLVDKPEGAAMTIITGYDPEQFRLTGQVAGQPPYNGILRHHGWKSTKCELPVWQGSSEAAQVIAPAEIELP